MTLMYVPVMRVEDLPGPGAMKAVEQEGYGLLVANVGGRYFVCSRTCPHEGADLMAGALMDDRQRCGNHGDEFELETGACVLPSGEPTLTVMPTEIQGEALCLRLEF